MVSGRRRSARKRESFTYLLSLLYVLLVADQPAVEVLRVCAGMLWYVCRTAVVVAAARVLEENTGTLAAQQQLRCAITVT